MRAPSMRALGVTLASGVLLTSMLTGCAQSQPTQAAQQPGVAMVAKNRLTVDISNMRFNPSVLRVRLGDTVTWEFNDQGTEHTVTSNADAQEAFASDVQGSGTFSHTFIRQGTSRYFCEIHSNMGGTVIVR
ncbi:cupredoxin domain-containing protein [Rhodococcus kronopolitis]|uniref:Plastocyanin/azurin family copper-binding protein n=1 Tax=Rhodococcus kronopolitis TaxID=1460226 RepID=A0ABV9FQ52_9NOCA